MLSWVVWRTARALGLSLEAPVGVRNDDAAARAEARGIEVIMNRCPKIEYGRLSGEIGWTGVNSRILSARKPQMLRGFQKFTIDRR